MTGYFRKHLINYQFLIIFILFLIVQLFLTFGLSRTYIGTESELFANEYSLMYQEKVLRFNNYLLIIVTTLIVILSHRKCDLPITIYYGKMKVALTRLFFTFIQIIFIFILSFATLTIFSTAFISYFSVSLKFSINYVKSFIDLLILFFVLQIFIKWDNKIIAPLITGTFTFIITIITDFEQYVPIYKYLFPINSLNIYNTLFGYLYLGIYTILLFLIYLLVKKNEQLRG